MVRRTGSDEFWKGSYLYVPGKGDQRLLLRDASNPHVPAPAANYPIVTANLWAVSCLSALKNPQTTTVPKIQGEGFLAIAPDGTKYYFDWYVRFPVLLLSKVGGAPQGVVSLEAQLSEQQNGSPAKPGSANGDSQPLPEVPPTTDAAINATLPRDEIWLMATRVEDRYGNWVTYTYDPQKPKNLTRIDSSDGRSLVLTYVPDTAGSSEVIKTVSDGTRTWTYEYAEFQSSASTIFDLRKVIQPDNTSWTFPDSFHNLFRPVTLQNNGGCEGVPMFSAIDWTGSIVHPSGATGTFTLRPTLHGRSKVQTGCFTPETPPDVPRYFVTQSVVNKTISGPGLTPLSWTIDYGDPNASWETCTNCPETKTVSVTDPESHVTRYTFGNHKDVNEGRLELKEVGWNGSSSVQTTAYRYRAYGAGPYPTYYGVGDPSNSGDSVMDSRPAPLYQRIITQQGVDFTWEALAFDAYAMPTEVRRSNTLGFTRTENTSYENNVSKWVLGQVKQVTETSTGGVMVFNQYNATTANLESVSNFGKLQQSITYNTDGTVATVKDGKNQITKFSNYKRGIAQRIDYADTRFESAVVNNIGKITSLTNEAGYTTTFGYDAMGRMSSITHPTSDSVTWNTTTINTYQVAGTELGLPPGHWRQQVKTGQGYLVRYFDALWRPVFTEQWDDGDTANSLRTLEYKYDSAGRTTFQSYPRRTFGQTVRGIYYTYDALGRQISMAAKSEVGESDGYAWTTTKWDYGFTKLVLDPRRQMTVFGYHVFDDPDQATIRDIIAPEGVTVAIARDVFGKPLSITRSGGNKGLTRRYVYDSTQRLCKTIEPENLATIQAYDDANNVSWRASGMNLVSGASCDNTGTIVPAASRVNYVYDARNRLKDTTFGDGSPAINTSYTADGLLNTVSSNGAVWTNTYNKRRLLERESLTYGGVTYNIGRGYDANGSLQQLTYPDGTAVAYNPNALGEPRQVGAYANAITYHPNGGIATFNYGNTTTGIKHSTTQNERGLPLRATDTGGVRDDQYGYDASGNVTSILDLLPSNVSNRSMIYDGLDRLKTATAPNMWGTATYGYDALDNLTSTTITGGITARATSHNINATTNRLDSITGGPPGFNVSYGYDNRGNVTLRNGQVFEYDLADRLKRAVGRATYTYDGFKRRVSVVGTDGVTRVQVYAQDGKLLYVAPGGGTPTKYVYMRNHVLAEVSGSTVTYNHTDALGSPVAQTNAAGTILSRTRYEPYGYIVAGTPRTIGFTGHVNDNDTGLVYMQQRYYDAFAGRLLEVDPVIVDSNTGRSFNRYTYALNNPYRYVDPDGRESSEQLLNNLWRGTETVLTGGYGHRVQDAINNGNFAAATGYTLMGTAYGLMNVATLGQGSTVSAAQRIASGSVLATAGMKATQEVYTGTIIPKSFELLAGRTNIWVHPNATKHMAEYATSLINKGISPEAVNLTSQIQLKSLQTAIAGATHGGIPFNKLIHYGGWELRFSQKVDDKLPVLMHALQTN